jgi:hypothetical protein
VTKPLHPTEFGLEEGPVKRRERRPVTMRGFIALEDGTTAEAYLLDLSYEGCGIETTVELTPGQEVKLSVLRLGAINAVVRWSSDRKAGLVFKSDKAANKQLQPRIAARKSVAAEVLLRRLGKINYRVRLFDLSPEGCKVELIERPSQGEHLMLKFEGFEVMDAEVCWVDDFIAGLRFEKPFHPAVFELLIARLR